MINFTFLSENKTENSRIKAEFGLSIYIETDCMKILFDAGASEIFYDNAERLGIDLQKISDQNGTFKKSTVLQLGIRMVRKNDSFRA